ncbi:MAG: hypothetical protein U0931_13995 [Vulcanimicrobiota bacterium]
MGRRTGGLSLIETMLASFILTAAILVTVTTFHRAMHYQARVERKILAAQVAHRSLVRLRSDCDDLTTWSSLSNRSWVETDLPEFTTTLTVSPVAVDSPCSGLESVVSTPIHLSASLKQVWIEVRWGGSAAEKVTITSFLTEPARRATQVRVWQKSGSTSLHSDQSGVFAAEARDADGRIIPDVTFDWQFASRQGVTREPSRDGRECRLTHVLYRPDGITRYYISGECRLRALARIQGEYIYGDGPVVSLSP